jgi:hypothetical protein
MTQRTSVALGTQRWFERLWEIGGQHWWLQGRWCDSISDGLRPPRGLPSDTSGCGIKTANESVENLPV